MKGNIEEIGDMPQKVKAYKAESNNLNWQSYLWGGLKGKFKIEES